MFQNKDSKKTNQSVNNSNIIGKGTVLDGNIETHGNIRIEGKVNGSVRTRSKAALGKSSYVEGNIMAQNAEIEGEVIGTVEVNGILTLKPTAVIHGDITTNKLVVESGATLNGGCKMGVTVKTIKMESNDQTQTSVLQPQLQASKKASVL